MTTDQSRRIDIFQNTPVLSAIRILAVPTILSQLVTMIYNLADAFFIGRIGDPVQVAAITLTFPLFTITVLIGNLFGIGANSVIARALGEKDYEKVRSASVFAVYGGAAGALLCSLLLFLFMKPVLTIIGASSATLPHTSRYISYTLVTGALPTSMSMILSHLLRAEGNAVHAGRGIALGGFLNIALDPMFMFTFHMEMAGAGLATLLSNVISCMYFVIVLYKRRRDSFLSFSLRRNAFNIQVSLQVLQIGFPAASVVICGMTGNIVMTHIASGYSDGIVASFGVMQKFATMTYYMITGLTQGVAPFIGYNYSAKNYSRVREINRDVLLLSTALIVILLFIVEIFADRLVLLFVTDNAVAAQSVIFLRRGYLCIIGMVYSNFFNALFQATGKWKSALALNVIRQLLLYVPCMIILNALFRVDGLTFAQPLAETLTVCVGFSIFMDFYRRYFPKTAETVTEQEFDKELNKGGKTK